MNGWVSTPPGEPFEGKARPPVDLFAGEIWGRSPGVGPRRKSFKYPFLEKVICCKRFREKSVGVWYGEAGPGLPAATSFLREKRRPLRFSPLAFPVSRFPSRHLPSQPRFNRREGKRRRGFSTRFENSPGEKKEKRQSALPPQPRKKKEPHHPTATTRGRFPAPGHPEKAAPFRGRICAVVLVPFAFTTLFHFPVSLWSRRTPSQSRSDKETVGKGEMREMREMRDRPPPIVYRSPAHRSPLIA
ncbi:hypothetical protein AKJ37_04110 [candidate division MSBL1 archaeon SCGC-AAA259I09]|uniref:Uncharacterized protein n=1 Tax=candidate division MSBL1 archaeon SCGC-AAA259I09 TaxID=1698267 RepID=A0A133URW6_9EURY|nr:hypothetical protein AKJ37_04110 [candidate division MSBL1 archaeon SCGC-AAA259I09]